MSIDEFGDHNYRDYEKQFIQKFRNSKYWYSRSGLSKVIQDDMLKWQKKLKNGKALHGTLVNLQNYCDATNLSPNDVLLPSGYSLNATELIEYVTYETVEAIVDYLTKNTAKIKKSYSFPLRYAPREMILLSMEIYIDTGLRHDKLIRFLMTEFTYDTRDNNKCNTYIVPDLEPTSEVIYNLSIPQENKYSFEDAYNIAIDLFIDCFELGQTSEHNNYICDLLMQWLPEDLCHGLLFSMFTSQHEYSKAEDTRLTGNLDTYMYKATEKAKSKE